MNRDSGLEVFPILLIADPGPVRWEEQLSHPLDPMHPSRYKIWTPILKGIRGRVFQARGASGFAGNGHGAVIFGSCGSGGGVP